MTSKQYVVRGSRTVRYYQEDLSGPLTLQPEDVPAPEDETESEPQSTPASAAPALPAPQLDSLPMNQQLVYGSPQNVQLLWISPDGAEAHFLAPRYDQQAGVRVGKGFGFIALRRVLFREPPVQTVGWCHDTRCTAPSGLGAVFRECHFQQAVAAEFLGETRPLCPCSSALLAANGGTDWLQHQLDAPRQDHFEADSTAISIPLSVRGQQYAATRAGPGLEDWGLLLDKGHSAKCTTCTRNKHNCRHIHQWNPAADGTDAEPGLSVSASTLADATWERELAAFLELSGPTAGQRRLSNACISQQRIPEEPSDDASLAATLAGMHCNNDCALLLVAGLG